MSFPSVAHVVFAYWPRTATQDAHWSPLESGLSMLDAFGAAKDHLEGEWQAASRRVRVVAIHQGNAFDVTEDFEWWLSDQTETCPDCDAVADECACPSSAEFQRREAKAAGHFA